MKRVKVSSLRQRLELILNGRLNDRVSELTDSHKLTIDQFIKLTKCGTRQSVHRWMNQDSIDPNLDSLDLIADKFKVSIDWLLGYDVLIDADKQYDYEVFKEYGFSYDFYNTLSLLKEKHQTKYTNYIDTLNSLFWDLEEFTIDPNSNEFSDVSFLLEDEIRVASIPVLDSLSKFVNREPHHKSYVIKEDILRDILAEFSQLGYDENKGSKRIIEMLTSGSNSVNYDYLDEAYLIDIRNKLTRFRKKLDVEKFNLRNAEKFE